ncbi:hypothetical protein [Synechococcus sp. UW140]|jgi:hypothetical protein|uniref:hypothetical protein n=1 Tax=Synechococcus sp. UW140 TaxID=368503 RepID=UPI001A7E0EE5|nr:hypothetical protein [Synechococcus sp. UW140]|tara:strand:- start:92 stop:268 length:177 start_codon:yes stop_codon:yes gene_type:complete
MSTAEQAYSICYKKPDGFTECTSISAADVVKARILAMEFNDYIKQHPNCICSILPVQD